MTNIHITEADVGRKFKTRSGLIAKIDRVSANTTYGFVLGARNHWSRDGRWNANEAKSRFDFDIVERLPEEGHKVTMDSLLKSAKPFGSANPKSKAPTMTASDGKQYPVQYWTTQQRFDEVTPPEGVSILVYSMGHGYSRYEIINGGLFLNGRGPRHEISEYLEWTWTLTPTPAVEKVEPQIWDEYISEDGDIFKMNDGEGACIWIRDSLMLEMSDHIDALHAWKNHVLSQHKGES